MYIVCNMINTDHHFLVTLNFYYDKNKFMTWQECSKGTKSIGILKLHFFTCLNFIFLLIKGKFNIENIYQIRENNKNIAFFSRKKDNVRSIIKTVICFKKELKRKLFIQIQIVYTNTNCSQKLSIENCSQKKKGCELW